MLKIIWFIPRPATDLIEAEELYQIGHVRRGMRQENLRRFRINLGLYPQPIVIQNLHGSQEPAVFRFSEGYWDSFEEIEECYRSPNGLAALADGMLNATPRVPAAPLPVLFGQEQEFTTHSRIAFDPFAGQYVEPRPAKVFAFLRLRRGQGESFDQAYADLAAEMSDVPGLGPHILTTMLDRHVVLGRSSRWPAADAETYDRACEFYFTDEDCMQQFLASPHFSKVLGLGTQHGEATTVIAVDPQEVFFTTVGRQPISQGWRDLYADQSATS